MLNIMSTESGSGDEVDRGAVATPLQPKYTSGQMRRMVEELKQFLVSVRMLHDDRPPYADGKPGEMSRLMVYVHSYYLCSMMMADSMTAGEYTTEEANNQIAAAKAFFSAYQEDGFQFSNPCNGRIVIIDAQEARLGRMVYRAILDATEDWWTCANPVGGM